MAEIVFYVVYLPPTSTLYCNRLTSLLLLFVKGSETEEHCTRFQTSRVHTQILVYNHVGSCRSYRDQRNGG